MAVQQKLSHKRLLFIKSILRRNVKYFCMLATVSSEVQPRNHIDIEHLCFRKSSTAGCAFLTRCNGMSEKLLYSSHSVAHEPSNCEEEFCRKFFNQMMQNTVIEKNFESNHRGEVMDNLNNERLSTAKFCDVTLEVGDRKFPVHKNILASISKYFENLFSTEMSEKYQKNIEIKEIKPDIFETIITFIYTTKITINENNVYDLLAAAKYLLVPHVEDYCTEFVLQLQNPENCLKIWEVARRFDAKKIAEKNLEFISKYFAAVVTSSDMKGFDVETLKSILEHKCKTSIDQESAYRVIVEWVKHSREEREQHFDELFHSLDLEYFTKVFLGSVVAEEELVEKNVRCQKRLITALKQKVLQAGQEPDPATSFLAFNHNFTSLQMFDIANCVRKEIARRAEPLYDACATVFDNFLYLIGGYTESPDKPTNAVRKISLVRNDSIWNNCERMNNCRYMAGAVACQGRIWVFGGNANENEYWENSEYFDPQIKTWQMVETFDEKPAYDLVTQKGMLYALRYGEVERTRYNTGNDSLEDVKFPINCVKAIVVNEEFYIVCRESERLYRLKRYDPVSQKSQDLGSLDGIKQIQDVCAVNGKIVMAVEREHAALSLYEFDFATNEWSLRWEFKDKVISKMISFVWKHRFKSPDEK